ncbi:MAG: PAS domain S-box protein [Thermodesulfobacteriota bacterium]
MPARKKTKHVVSPAATSPAPPTMTTEVERPRQLHEAVDWTQRCDFFKSFIDELIEPVIVIDTDFNVKYANKAAHLLSGSPYPCAAAGSFCHKLLFNSDRQCQQLGQECLLKKVMEQGRHVTVDHAVEYPDGERKIFEILGSPIWDKDKKLLGIVSTIRDVTQHRIDQKMLETGHDFLELRVQERTSELIDVNLALRQEIKERQETEQRLRWAKEQAELIYQVSPCAIFTVDTNRYVTSWNNKTEEITGYSYDEIKGRKCDIFCSEKCRLFDDAVNKPILNRECSLRTKDGRLLTITKSADLLHDPQGNVIGGIESFEDITERKNMATMLRAERDKFHSIITATRQGLHILNADYEIEFQNDVLKNIFGDQIGAKCYKVYKQRDEPCSNCRMHSVMANNQIEYADDIIFHNRHYSQSYASFRDIDGQMKCLVLLQDITVEKVNRAKAMRTAQLASIGELAAGVAHEINNPINGIINYAQLLLDDAAADEPRSNLLKRLINEGERVADIVSKLLAFARQRDEEQLLDQIDIRTVLGDAFSLFQHQFAKEGIVTHIDIPAEIPSLHIHPHQLQQVFVNLLSNARHALNERFPGPHPEKLLEISADLPGQTNHAMVRITFTDYGTGIAPETLDMVFNPFFSTKKPGEGTGLGLSISQGLIHSFKGQIHIESRLGEYTSVIIELPM